VGDLQKKNIFKNSSQIFSYNKKIITSLHRKTNF